MSKKWKIITGVVAAVLVFGAISTAVSVGFVARSRMLSRGWEAWEAPEHLTKRAPLNRGFATEGRMPFHRGMAPDRGMPFGRSFSPNRMGGMVLFGGLFAAFGGLLHLAGLGLVVWLAVSYRRCRRGLCATQAADPVIPATGSEREA